MRPSTCEEKRPSTCKSMRLFGVDIMPQVGHGGEATHGKSKSMAEPPECLPNGVVRPPEVSGSDGGASTLERCKSRVETTVVECLPNGVVRPSEGGASTLGRCGSMVETTVVGCLSNSVVHPSHEKTCVRPSHVSNPPECLSNGVVHPSDINIGNTCARPSQGRSERQLGLRRIGTEEALDLNRNAWTQEEHRAFIEGLETLGKGDWKGIAKKFVPSRTHTQVASHAQKYFKHLAATQDRRQQKASVFDIPVHYHSTAPEHMTDIRERRFTHSTIQAAKLPSSTHGNQPPKIVWIPVILPEDWSDRINSLSANDATRTNNNEHSIPNTGETLYPSDE